MLPLNLSLCFHICMSIVVNRVKLNDLVKVTRIVNCSSQHETRDFPTRGVGGGPWRAARPGQELAFSKCHLGAWNFTLVSAGVF